MGTVIITGASGFLGNLLVRKMLENDNRVIAVALDFPEDKLFDHPSVTKIEMNICSHEDLLKAIPEGRYDAFYHLAWRGVNGPEKADAAIQIENVKSVISCALAAKTLGCKRFLCAGTVAERATQSLPLLNAVSGSMMYGAAKHCAHLMLEAYCKSIGMDFIWMQFSNSYGPTNKSGNLVSYMLTRLMNDSEATFGPAEQPYDFIFVDDMIEAAYRLGFCEKHKDFYFIGSGAPRILKDYLNEIGKICDRPDLVKIGVRADDGIKYDMSMFDTSDLVEDIGSFVSRSFEEGIRYTVRNYQ